MKLFNLLTRIICASLLITVSPYVFAGSFSGAEAQKILDQNPQVKKAGVLPTNMRTSSGDQCREFSEGRHNYHSDALSASLKGITFNHTCFGVESDKGFRPYEKGYGEKRYFKIVLHLDTPKVWRVYEVNRSHRKGTPDDVSILAEFDIHGKRVEATASESSQQAEQSAPVSTNRKSLREQLAEKCATASNTKSDRTIAECRIYYPGSPGSERNHEAGSPGGDDASAPPPTAESQVEDVVKKGIGNLFKGFGR